MANFILNFFSDSSGVCCSGDCTTVDVTGCACSGDCLQYSCLCSGGGYVCDPDDGARSLGGTTCTTAMCWTGRGQIFNEDQFSVYEGSLYQSAVDDNEEEPSESSSWYDSGECPNITLVDIPCSVLMHQSGCVTKYIYEGDCHYYPCDQFRPCSPDPDFVQLFMNDGQSGWKTLGYNAAPGEFGCGGGEIEYWEKTGCSPLGTYENPSGSLDPLRFAPLEITLCTLCSGCDCGETGVMTLCGPSGWQFVEGDVYGGCLDA